MFRILVVSNLFQPDRGGGGSVFTDLCIGLAEKGFDVTVYTTYPYYPEWENKSGANLLKVSRESLGDMTVRRFGLHIPSQPSRLVSRLLYEGSFFVSLLRALNPPELQRYDLILTFCPLLSAVAYGALVSALTGVPLWVNIQDIPVEAARSTGISRSRLFDKLAVNVQAQVFAAAETWSTISPEMRHKLDRDYNLYNRPIYYLPNWLNPTLATEIEDLPDRFQRPMRKPIQLLYAGNIGKKQNLLECCRFLHRQRQNFTFRIYGAGAEADCVRQWVASTGDERFHFGSFLGERDFALALHDTDFFLITQAQNDGASFIPSKLIPAIASATPIVAVCDHDSPLGREVIDFRLGYVFDWTAIHTILPQLEKLATQHQRFVEVRQNCRRRSHFFTREAGIKRFVDALVEVRPRTSVLGRRENSLTSSDEVKVD